MRIRICAIGRMKSGPESDLLARYLDRSRAAGRILGLTSLTIAENPESPLADAARRREAEAAALLGQVSDGAFAVALDEKGRDMDSAGLSRLMRSRLDDSTPEIAFLIGGPDGHGETALAAASLRLAFGSATWPHQLVRVMLAEQIYRAVTILSGHPYHRA